MNEELRKSFTKAELEIVAREYMLSRYGPIRGTTEDVWLARYGLLLDAFNELWETKLEAIKGGPSDREEAFILLREMYHTLSTEALLDPTNEWARKLAIPLEKKMARVNEIMKFKP